MVNLARNHTQPRFSENFKSGNALNAACSRKNSSFKLDSAKHVFNLPKGGPWVLVTTRQGRRFVHNRETQQSFWKIPSDVLLNVIEFDRLRREGINVSSLPNEEQPVKRLGEATLSVEKDSGKPDTVESSCNSVENNSQNVAESDTEFEVIEEYVEEEAEEDGPDALNATEGSHAQEFTEDDIAWQLELMRQEEAESGADETPNLPDDQSVKVCTQEETANQNENKVTDTNVKSESKKRRKNKKKNNSSKLQNDEINTQNNDASSSSNNVEIRFHEFLSHVDPPINPYHTLTHILEHTHPTLPLKPEWLLYSTMRERTTAFESWVHDTIAKKRDKIKQVKDSELPTTFTFNYNDDAQSAFLDFLNAEFVTSQSHSNTSLQQPIAIPHYWAEFRRNWLRRNILPGRTSPLGYTAHVNPLTTRNLVESVRERIYRSFVAQVSLPHTERLSVLKKFIKQIIASESKVSKIGYSGAARSSTHDGRKENDELNIQLYEKIRTSTSVRRSIAYAVVEREERQRVLRQECGLSD